MNFTTRMVNSFSFDWKIKCTGLIVILLVCIIGFVDSASAAGCGASQSFKTVWKTDNTGTSNSTSITIPTNGGGYSYQVDWNNDGDFVDLDEAGPFVANKTHDFGVAGTYEIGLCGSFPSIYFNDIGDKEKLLDITQWGDNAWVTMQNSFWGTKNLIGTFTDVADVSGVTTMSNAFLDAENFNGDITGWDVSNVTSMSNMFNNASSFNQDISGWNTGSVASFYGTFYGTSAFNQPIGVWDTSNANRADNMFAYSNFNQPIEIWDLSNMLNMDGIFWGNTSFNQPLNGWDTSNVTKMGNMFHGASSFNQPIGLWDTSNVTDMTNMFNSATIFNQNISLWDVSSVTDMTFLFGDTDDFNQPIGAWDTSSLITTVNMFHRAKSFNQPIGGWNMSNVTDMRYMFNQAPVFNQSIGTWDISGVSSLQSVFFGAKSFNQSLGSWNTSGVTDMQEMFSGATSFNQPIGGWDSSNVTNMSAMFSGISYISDNCVYDDGYDGSGIDYYTEDCDWTYIPMAFNQDISGWDVSSVTNMRRMFAQGANQYRYAETYDNNTSDYEWSETYTYDSEAQPNAFNQDISGWDVSDVTNMSEMFLSGLDQHVVGEDVLGDPIDTYTFSAGSTYGSFNRSLSLWNMGAVTEASGMLIGSGLSVGNYDDTLIGWSAQVLQAGVTLGANGLAYCDSEAQRQSIIDVYSWTIVDDGKDCVPPTPAAPILVNPTVGQNTTDDTSPTFIVECSGQDYTSTLIIDGVPTETVVCDTDPTEQVRVTGPMTLGTFDISSTSTNRHNLTSLESGITTTFISTSKSTLANTGMNATATILTGVTIVVFGHVINRAKVYKKYNYYK